MRKKLKAFSLIELSVVIIIVSVLIAGVTQGSKMIAYFRISSAQTLTLSSVVNTTTGLVLWLETSMPESFIDVESNDGVQLTKWFDRNPQALNRLVAKATASPAITYKANGDAYSLPAVSFNGSSASAVFTLTNDVVNTFIVTPDNSYTFFIVAKLKDDSSASAKTIFSNGDSSGWGYGVLGTQNNRSRTLLFNGSTNVTTSTANATTRPEVISAFYTGGAGGSLQLFTNGVGSAGSGDAGTAEILNSTSATAVTPNTAFYIGNKSSNAPWTGEIYEIILFNRVLSTKERAQVEAYLGQKYNIKINSAENITGCPVSLPGSTTTQVSEGKSNINCNVTGYSGTVPYDCSGGVLSLTGSCASTVCTITGKTGFNDKTNLPYTVTPDLIPNTPTTACSSGYIGSPTYTCLGAGEANITLSQCVAIICNASAGTGYNAQSNLVYAESGSGSFGCNTAGGYVGSVNYTCITSGVATITANNCAKEFYCSSGGNVVNSGGRRIHTFTAASTTLSSCIGYTTDLDILVVGGGGGGGNSGPVGSGSGGGGGGGVTESLDNMVSVTSNFVVTVGAGGAKDANGSPSSFVGNGINISVVGGGKGGKSGIDPGPGGGGYGYYCCNGVQSGGVGTGTFSGGSGYGNISSGVGSGGGGGSSSENGGDASSTTNGKGAAAFQSSISGSSVKYAPGGGGGGPSSNGAVARGTGGDSATCGGSGAWYYNGGGAIAAVAQTCYGGGGGGGNLGAGSLGGKAGIIIISYPYTP